MRAKRIIFKRLPWEGSWSVWHRVNGEDSLLEKGFASKKEAEKWAKKFSTRDLQTEEHVV